MAVDGADVSEEEVRSKERVCILFDGNDQDALICARAQWKMLSDAHCHTQYWSEETGRWQKRLKRTSPNDHIDRLTFQDHLIIADFNCSKFGQIPHA